MMFIRKLRKTVRRNSGKRCRVFQNRFWILMCLLTSTLMWYYSKFWWSNFVHDEDDLCSRWTSIDRTIKRCQGQPLSWTSRITNFTRVTSADENSKLSGFKPKLTTETYSELMELLRVFSSACEKSSIPWITHSGTLIGAVRHFGMVPWDDDIDVMVDIQYKGRLEHAVSTMNNPSYQIFEYWRFQWKFYKVSNRAAHANNASNPLPPFIDIFFYDYQPKRIVVRLLSKRFVPYFYQIADMFPTKLRPFEEFLLPIPNNAIHILDHDFQRWNNTCMSTKTLELDCKELYGLYPFVFRNKLHAGGETSMLKLGDKPKLTLEYENEG